MEGATFISILRGKRHVLHHPFFLPAGLDVDVMAGVGGGHEVALAMEVMNSKIETYHGSLYKPHLFLPNFHMRRKYTSILIKSLLFQGF